MSVQQNTTWTAADVHAVVDLLLEAGYDDTHPRAALVEVIAALALEVPDATRAKAEEATPRPKAVYKGQEWFYGGPHNDACTRHRLYRDDGEVTFVFDGEFSWIEEQQVEVSE